MELWKIGHWVAGHEVNPVMIQSVSGIEIEYHIEGDEVYLPSMDVKKRIVAYLDDFIQQLGN